MGYPLCRIATASLDVKAAHKKVIPRIAAAMLNLVSMRVDNFSLRP